MCIKKIILLIFEPVKCNKIKKKNQYLLVRLKFSIVFNENYLKHVCFITYKIILNAIENIQINNIMLNKMLNNFNILNYALTFEFYQKY